MATARVATTILRLLPVFVYGSGDPCGRYVARYDFSIALDPYCNVNLHLIDEGRCHPERSEGSLPSGRSFASLRMTDKIAHGVAPLPCGCQICAHPLNEA